MGSTLIAVLLSGSEDSKHNTVCPQGIFIFFLLSREVSCAKVDEQPKRLLKIDEFELSVR